MLPPETTVVRAVWPDDDPDWVQSDVRDLLARFGLTGEIVFQTVGQLSGGEKAKAALARLAATGANLLIMDEPTNHLDIWSCEALERSIREFEGTVLVVSHDRYFLNQVADRLIVLGDGRARVIEGDYETYQRLAEQDAGAAARAPGTSSPRRGLNGFRRQHRLGELASEPAKTADAIEVKSHPVAFNSAIRSAARRLPGRERHRRSDEEDQQADEMDFWGHDACSFGTRHHRPAGTGFAAAGPSRNAVRTGSNGSHCNQGLGS